jgi:Ca2+-binding RTX toxin-like protein
VTDGNCYVGSLTLCTLPPLGPAATAVIHVVGRAYSPKPISFDAAAAAPAFDPSLADNRSVGALTPTCSIMGTASDDVLIGTSGADSICGMSGDDVVVATAGTDTIVGGPGDDTVTFRRAPGAVDADMSGSVPGGTVDVSGWGHDDLVGIEGVAGSRFGDQMIEGWGGKVHVLSGNGGDDQLTARRGADRLVGGAGDDHLNAIDFVKGNDVLRGGPGTDVCRADADDRRNGCP